MTSATSDTHKLGTDWRVRRDDEAASASPEGAVHGPGEQWRTDRPNEAFTDPLSGDLGSDWRTSRDDHAASAPATA